MPDRLDRREFLAEAVAGVGCLLGGGLGAPLSAQSARGSQPALPAILERSTERVPRLARRARRVGKLGIRIDRHAALTSRSHQLPAPVTKSRQFAAILEGQWKRGNWTGPAWRWHREGASDDPLPDLGDHAARTEAAAAGSRGTLARSTPAPSRGQPWSRSRRPRFVLWSRPEAGSVQAALRVAITRTPMSSPAAGLCRSVPGTSIKEAKSNG